MRILFLSLITLSLFSCNEKQPTTQGPINAKDLYTTRCAACHGMDGKLSIAGAKPLQTSSLDQAAVVSQIKSGKGSMPPFEGRLSDEEINAVAQFVLTLRTP
jgi:mono/diheme cytochrome c family protein